MTKNNKKQFDCIAMKSNIQKQIFDETKNMTANELLRYFNGNGSKAPISQLSKKRINREPH